MRYYAASCSFWSIRGFVELDGSLSFSFLLPLQQYGMAATTKTMRERPFLSSSRICSHLARHDWRGPCAIKRDGLGRLTQAERLDARLNKMALCWWCALIRPGKHRCVCVCVCVCTSHSPQKHQTLMEGKKKEEQKRPASIVFTNCARVLCGSLGLETMPFV